MYEVIQEDRDAAADYLGDPLIRAGSLDHHPLVRLLARHRLNTRIASRPSVEDVERLRPLLERAADFAGKASRFDWNEDRCIMTAIHLHADLQAALSTPTAEQTPSLVGELRCALKQADEALRNYACHGGPSVPCLRSEQQCASECGKLAGDALVVVDAALATAFPGEPNPEAQSPSARFKAGAIDSGHGREIEQMRNRRQ